jgi:hypothetical protein
MKSQRNKGRNTQNTSPNSSRQRRITCPRGNFPASWNVGFKTEGMLNKDSTVVHFQGKSRREKATTVFFQKPFKVP